MIASAPSGIGFNKRLLLHRAPGGPHPADLLADPSPRGTRFWGFVVLYGVLLVRCVAAHRLDFWQRFSGSQSVSSILGGLHVGLRAGRPRCAVMMPGTSSSRTSPTHPVFYFTIALSALSVVCTYYTRKTHG